MSSATAPPALDSTMGALLLAVVLSAVVYGINCLQVYIYYTEASVNDSTWLKAFVAILFACDGAHLGLCIHAVYAYLVTGFGDYQALALVPSSLLAAIAVGNVLGVAVLWFYAWRIYLLSRRKNWIVPAIVILLTLGLFAGGLGTIITGKRITVWTHFSAAVGWVVGGFVPEVVANVLVMLSMIYYLRKGAGPFQKTNRLINAWVTYLLNSFLPTAAFAILTVALFAWNPRQLYYMPFFFLLIRLYSCAFMSTLNSRQSARSQLSGVNIESGDMTLGHVQNSRDLSHAARSQRGQVVLSDYPAHIEVQKVTITNDY